MTLGQAATVHTMPFAESNRDGYLATSERILSIIDSIITVWAGGPSGGHGGTADVVEVATDRQIPVIMGATGPSGCIGGPPDAVAWNELTTPNRMILD